MVVWDILRGFLICYIVVVLQVSIENIYFLIMFFLLFFSDMNEQLKFEFMELGLWVIIYIVILFLFLDLRVF